MSYFYEFVLLSCLYIVIAGLSLLLIRKIMQKLGSSTVSIYPFWWMFMAGFGLMLILQFYNPKIELATTMTQSINRATIYVSINQVAGSHWSNSIFMFLFAISLLLLLRLVFKYFHLKNDLMRDSVQKTTVIFSPLIKSPLAFGVFKSHVFVPHDFEVTYTKLQQKLLLEHEQVHCRRYDPMLLVLYKILISLFWFHPLLYLLNYCMKKDQESSCDELVLQNSHQSAEYSNLLLQLNQQTNNLINHPELTCSSSSMLKERIMLIKNLQPQSLVNKLLSKSLLVVSTLGLIVTTTALAEIVQLSQSQQKYVGISAPPKPDKFSNREQKHTENQQIGILVPKPDAVIAPKQPKSPTSPISPDFPTMDNSQPNNIVAISTPRPYYPRKAALNNISGFVVVEFEIMQDGSVKNPKVVESKPQDIFDKQALLSVEKYKFEPMPEKVKIKQKIEFSTKS